jgi:hypothetical protein
MHAHGQVATLGAAGLAPSHDGRPAVRCDLFVIYFDNRTGRPGVNRSVVDMR